MSKPMTGLPPLPGTSSPARPPLQGPNSSRRGPKRLGNTFCFHIRDDKLEDVLESLRGGLDDPSMKYLPPKNEEPSQNLMFFAAARKQKVGGAEAVARRLHELGVAANTIDHFRQNPVFYAAREGSVECVEFLIEQGCDVNQNDVNGQTAVFYATREGRMDVVEKLVQLGADPDHHDQRGRPASYLAKAAAAQAKPRRLAGPGAGVRGRQPVTQESPGADDEPASKRVRKEDEGMKLEGTPAEGLEDPLASWVADPGPADHVPGGEGMEVLATAGEYVACFPAIDDVPRLRALEREFVADHADIFRESPWHAAQTPDQWCDLVNVIKAEGSAHAAIRSIVEGKTKNHFTVMCVHKAAGQPPSVVGYLHHVRDNLRMDLSHLKVSRRHQGRGLGSLLVAGALEVALRTAWQVRSLYLVVAQKNERATALYRRMGFDVASSVQKRMKGGRGGCITWLRMERAVAEPMHAVIAGFVDACRERAATLAAAG